MKSRTGKFSLITRERWARRRLRLSSEGIFSCRRSNFVWFIILLKKCWVSPLWSFSPTNYSHSGWFSDFLLWGDQLHCKYHSTLSYKYDNISLQDRVMVSLTLMLVIATITASIQMVIAFLFYSGSWVLWHKLKNYCYPLSSFLQPNA